MPLSSDGARGSDQNSEWKWLQACQLHTALKGAQSFSSTGGFQRRKTSLCTRNNMALGKG